jgi:hypothetical protein
MAIKAILLFRADIQVRPYKTILQCEICSGRPICLPSKTIQSTDYKDLFTGNNGNYGNKFA